MIIDRSIAKYAVFTEESLLTALRKISENKGSILVAITDSGIVEGVLTDGDFRRWLVEQSDIDLNQPVSAVMNRTFVVCSEHEPAERIEERLSDRIAFVPLVDRQNRLVGVASRRSARLQIGEFSIDAESPAFVIAEIGNNHNGNLELAMRLVDEAVAAGANCAKFQMRRMEALYSNAGDADDASADLGAQYTLDLLARFQLSDEQMFAAFDHCKARGILPLCTPWDKASLVALEEYGMAAYKVASADLTNHELIEALAATRKPLIVSTGMSTEAEIRDSVQLLKRLKAQYVLLHVNSTYPAPFKDIHLKYMARLEKIGECPVGYSGHERGISVPIAAVARGAKVIEKHLTIDRSMEGNDHRVSLLPAEFAAMVQGIREVEEALGSVDERRITQGELMNREVLGKSLVAGRAIEVGETIVEEAISVRSPGQGLSPYRKHALIGRRATRAFAQGDVFFPSDLEDGSSAARHYRFNRPFGIPVRHHDLRRMLPMSNFDMVEFHLSYKDLDVDPGRFLEERYDLDFVVHAPELFAGDHVLDLCADDLSYRRRSIDELQRVVDVTRALKPRFSKAPRPLIVINAGGFSMDGPLPVSQRSALYERIAESLSQIDTAGVEIIPQTMPPFPWHFGGQRFHNLFVDAGDIAAFCTRYGYRVCLDVSHSSLACNHMHLSFKNFLEQVGPLTAHMHMVDAAGVDGEGLQIGEGDIDFAMVGEVLDRVAPKASFIPEIWQGHKDNGSGFWLALERLEPWLGQR